MPPFRKRYRVVKERSNAGLSGGNIHGMEELLVGTCGVSAPISEFPPDELCLVPAQPIPLPRFNMSLPDNGSIPSSSTMVTADASGSSSGAPKTALRMSFDLIANFIPHFDGKPSSITNFISQCRLADSLVRLEDKVYLLAIIRNRMQKRDYSRIVDGNEPKTVEELINFIKAAYEQSFDIKTAQDKLKVIRRAEHETIEEFGTRVHEILDQGLEAAQEKFNTEQLIGIKVLLTEEAIAGFLRGIRNDTIMLLIAKDNISSLTTVIKLASKMEHQLLHKNEPMDSKISANKLGVFTVNADERKCFNCNGFGHFRINCPTRNNNFNQSNRDRVRCNHCRKTGHIESQCYVKNARTTWRRSQPQVNTTSGNQKNLNSKGVLQTGPTQNEPMIARAGSIVSATTLKQ